MINKRQLIILIFICTLSTKLQRLFSLTSGACKEDGWLVLLALGAVDVLFMLLALWFFNKFNSKMSFFAVLEKFYGKFLARALMFFIGVYFFLTAVLPFEAIHDLFSNMLFNQIEYHYFGLIFLVVIIFMAIKGIQAIGRTGEIFVSVITIGLVCVLLLGFFTADFSKLLPIGQSDFNVLIKEALLNSMWFGDFLLLFFLTGKVSLKENEKLKWSIILPHGVLAILVVPFSYAIFEALYENLSGFQTNAISSLTQFSLLSFDLGRWDWYFVLLEQISTIIAAAVFILAAGEAICLSFNIKKPGIVIAVIGGLLFTLDSSVFRDINASAYGYRELFYVFGAIVNYAFPLFFTLCGNFVKPQGATKICKEVGNDRIKLATKGIKQKLQKTAKKDEKVRKNRKKWLINAQNGEGTL